MPYPKIDRFKLDIRKLSERKSLISIIDESVSLKQHPPKFTVSEERVIEKTVERIKSAKKNKSSIMLVFGAHTIKNGLRPILNTLMELGWVTHMATNGAGIIHDWEFAFQGRSSEDVRANVKKGQFGIWEETGFYIYLALIVGAYEGLGYGELVGKMISQGGIYLPEYDTLVDIAKNNIGSDPDRAAASIDLAGVIERFKLNPGFMDIPHPYNKFPVQSRANEIGIPFTGHPMIGHDIIYTHPVNHGAAIGRTALNDFLSFAESVYNLENGVYISLGSSVMCPMIFEKALSMAQNIMIGRKKLINQHYILVVDLIRSQWDWEKNGEPPKDDPAYYLRFCKTFNRMGGEMSYLTADNRDFLLTLCQRLMS